MIDFTNKIVQYVKETDTSPNCSVIIYPKTGNKSSMLSIPIDPDNRHYQEVLEWVAEGNTIQEAD
tara:strand:- start:27 stop:221 length:195 start_codon:yes stop_codon:yes gene_type:complete